MVDIEEILNGERDYDPPNLENVQTLENVEKTALCGYFYGRDANQMILRLIEIIKALQAEQPNG